MIQLSEMNLHHIFLQMGKLDGLLTVGQRERYWDEDPMGRYMKELPSKWLLLLSCQSYNSIFHFLLFIFLSSFYQRRFSLTFLWNIISLLQWWFLFGGEGSIFAWSRCPGEAMYLSTWTGEWPNLVPDWILNPFPFRSP